MDNKVEEELYVYCVECKKKLTFVNERDTNSLLRLEHVLNVVKLKKIEQLEKRKKLSGVLCPECKKCACIILSKNSESIKQETSERSRNSPSLLWLVAFICVLVATAGIFQNISVWKQEPVNETIGRNIIELRKNFPSQRNETWRGILGALTSDLATPKVLLFLYSDAELTCKCLVKQLAEIFNNENSKEKFIKFHDILDNDNDYGDMLDKVRSVIRKNKVLHVHLNSVSVRMANIFHPVCDESYSKENPVLIIFTLR
ncbi:hypothetical protein RUM44_006357 [Polyplax serrata]|uniref:Uncharacterized protein n=1 Tax=Polyplax serrata TaxID=468196 RepID=A0ABR1AI18_POLSC